MPAFVRYRKRRRTWIVRSRFDDVERDRTFGGSEADKARAIAFAERLNYEDEARREVAEREAAAVDSGSLTRIAALADSFLDAQGWTYSDHERASLDARFRLHLVPAFGHLEPKDLTDLLVHRFVTEKLETLRPYTIANQLSALRRLLHAAKADGVIEQLPAPGLSKAIGKLQRRGRAERNVGAWTHAERDVLITLAEAHERRLVVPLTIAFYTGARLGEVLGLWWQDVDRARSQIRIDWQLTAKLERKPPKWDSRRPVPLADELARRLEVHAQRLRLDDPWGEPGFVIHGPNGGPWRPDSFQRAYQRLMRHAVAAGIRPLTFHCTRHTFATHAIEGGKSAKWVSTMLGHRSVAFTLDLYGHLLPGEISDLSFLNGDAYRSLPSAGRAAPHLRVREA